MKKLLLSLFILSSALTGFSQRDLIGMKDTNTVYHRLKALEDRVTALPSAMISGNGLASEFFVLTNSDNNVPGMMKALGSVMKGWPIGSPYPASAASALTNGTINWSMISIPTAQTITGIKFYLSTAGSYTATGYNGVALYSVGIVGSTATFTLVGSSNSSNTIWSGSAVLTAVPFSSPVVVPGGLYLVCSVYNRSAEVTAPQLNTIFATGKNYVLDFVDGLRLFGSTTGTTFPATVTSTSGSPGLSAGTAFWYAVY